MDHLNPLLALTAALAHGRLELRVNVVDPPDSMKSALEACGARLIIRPNRLEWLAACEESEVVLATGGGIDVRRQAIEAIGHGCVPILLGEAGADELRVRDGETGVIVAAGDWAAAAERVKRLAADPEARTATAARAHDAVRNLEYRSDQMIDAYLDVFGGVIADIQMRTFQRLPGPILPPPAEVAGESLFPVALDHTTTDGAFPTGEDADRFREERFPDNAVQRTVQL